MECPAIKFCPVFPDGGRMAVRVASTRRAPRSERWLPHAVIATCFVVVLPAVLVSLLVPAEQRGHARPLAPHGDRAVAAGRRRRRGDLEAPAHVGGPGVRRPHAVGLAAALGGGAAAGAGRDAARQRPPGRERRGADRPQRAAGGAGRPHLRPLPARHAARRADRHHDGPAGRRGGQGPHRRRAARRRQAAHAALDPQQARAPHRLRVRADQAPPRRRRRDGRAASATPRSRR